MTRSEPVPESRPAPQVRSPREPTGRPSGPSELPAGAEVPLLPDTARLLTLLQETEAPDRLPTPAEGPASRTASYCARPDESGPFLRFHVEEADESLLRLVRRSAPGFEVLQSHRDMFKYHWRGDLARAFEEEVSILSRYWAFAGERAIAVEHLVAPVIVRHRVRELRGWFTFSEEMTDGAGPIGRIAILRRPLRSRIVRLHDCPRTPSTLGGGPDPSRGNWRGTLPLGRLV